MTTRFIADLHLQASHPALTEAFFRYLNTTAQDASALYILGDLFEHWIGDDGMGPFERQVAEALRQYSDDGHQLYFMHGNRDFLIKDTFAQLAGLTLLDDPTVVTLDNERVLLMHGDSMCIQDQVYMQFRAQVRSPAWQQQVLAMPLQQRLALAEQLRVQSGEANATKADQIMDVDGDEVVRQMNTHAVTTLIHGHTHRPADHSVQLGNGLQGRRLVLGDWREQEAASQEIVSAADTLTLTPYRWA